MSFTYKAGTIPVILLNLHDGNKHYNCAIRSKLSNGVPKKSWVIDNDTRTSSITNSVYSTLSEKGYKPYVLINNVHRSDIDLNRSLSDACAVKCEQCVGYYIQFHNKLFKLIAAINNKFGRCLIFDIHGNRHSKNLIQFGYNIGKYDLLNGNHANNSFSHSLSKYPSYDYLLGEKSLSYFYTGLFDNVFPVYNKVTDAYLIKSNSKYYGGRQKMMEYKDAADIVLVELSKDLREDPSTPNRLAIGLIDYLKNVYLNL
jgi:N-formylglutamate amidohydrolase|tara:strand:+ start:1143 stop:1913 length:771 start_codon:yes stop_codon:yes gene_type:complete